MKIETEKECDVLFEDVKCGQCFKHISSSNFYIRIHKPTGSNSNCVNVLSGWSGICHESDAVRIFKDAKVVLNG